MKDVTAAIIVNNGRVLIAKRAPGQKMAGMWEFPGGKIEPGETPEQCLRREIGEEFDTGVEVLEFFGESIYEYDHGTIRLLGYFCRWLGGEFRLHVHSRIEWVTGEELAKYEFAPADVSLVEKLKGELD